MWNLAQIREKKKYVECRLKNVNDEKEKEKLELSLITYMSLLDNSGTLRYTKFYNLLDKINTNYSLKREYKYAIMETDLFFKDKPKLDDNYIKFLIDICYNVSETSEDFIESDFTFYKSSYENLINVSMEFYKSLGDEEILEKASSILSDKSSINVSNVHRNGMNDRYGQTFNDYVFDKSYISIVPNNSIFDYQVLNHEVMHGINFYTKEKVPSENYYGFHEIPTYTIDYLFIDYLKKIGFDEEEVNKLKVQKDNYIYSLACITKMQLETELIRNKTYRDYNVQDIKNVLSPLLIKQLLEVESGVIAYGLYNQIKSDNNLDNLKSVMKTILSKNEIPNFNFIGLYNETLLDLSKKIGSYSQGVKGHSY